MRCLSTVPKVAGVWFRDFALTVGAVKRRNEGEESKVCGAARWSTAVCRVLCYIKTLLIIFYTLAIGISCVRAWGYSCTVPQTRP